MSLWKRFAGRSSSEREQAPYSGQESSQTLRVPAGTTSTASAATGMPSLQQQEVLPAAVGAAAAIPTSSVATAADDTSVVRAIAQQLAAGKEIRQQGVENEVTVTSVESSKSGAATQTTAATPVGRQHEVAIHPGISIAGTLYLDDGHVVAGTCEGRIVVDGALHLAVGSRVAADVTCESITAAGEYEGNIEARSAAHIARSATMQGRLELWQPALTVESGSTLALTIVMPDSDSASSDDQLAMDEHIS